MDPSNQEDSSTTPDPSENKTIDEVKKPRPTKKNTPTIASIVRSIELYSGLKPAAEDVELPHDIEKIAVEQVKNRSILTPEDLWQLPKISKKNQKRSARDAGLDDNPAASKTKVISTDEVEAAKSIAFPKIEDFDPVEEYKYAYIWAEAHPNCAPGPGIEDLVSPTTTDDIKSDELALRRLFRSRRPFAAPHDFWVSYQREHACKNDNDEDPRGLTYWWTRALAAEVDALKAEGEQRSATAILEAFRAENHALATALNELEEEYAGYKRLHSRAHVNSLIRKEKAKLADRIGALDYEVKDLKIQLKKANEKATEAEKKCREAVAGETRARSEKRKENYNLKLKVENLETEKAKLQKEKDKLAGYLAECKSVVEELDKELAKGKCDIEELTKKLMEERARVERRTEDLAKRTARIEELEMEVEMYKSLGEAA
ncbi:hypothetical protein MBLNU457_g0417t1 [Dothideomycetes sp. NU457]